MSLGPFIWIPPTFDDSQAILGSVFTGPQLFLGIPRRVSAQFTGRKSLTQRDNVEPVPAKLLKSLVPQLPHLWNGTG